jgi:hypothetical protein
MLYTAPIFTKLAANDYVVVDICLNEFYPNTDRSA